MLNTIRIRVCSGNGVDKFYVDFPESGDIFRDEDGRVAFFDSYREALEALSTQRK